jgi:hypothetical protein
MSFKNQTLWFRFGVVFSLCFEIEKEKFFCQSKYLGIKIKKDLWFNFDQKLQNCQIFI